MFMDKSLSYGERLQKSGLTMYTSRPNYLRGDLIEMFKIFTGFDDKIQKKISLSSTELIKGL